VGETVSFDSSASVPNGGSIVSYEWNFGDGNTSTTQNPTHVYNSYGTGTYTVTLNVTDSEDLWDAESKNITLQSPPVADFTWSPEHPFVNEMVIFDASSSYDLDGYIVSYSWEFVGGPYRPVRKYGVIVNFTFKSVDPYSVYLTIKDNEDLLNLRYAIIYPLGRTAQDISISPPEKKYVASVEPLNRFNNTEFAVDVVITNVTDCAGYQFKVDYNSTFLSVVSRTFDTDPANPLSPTQMAPVLGDRLDSYLSTPGHLQMATVWKAEVPTYTYVGDSVAARITFKITYSPAANNTISSNLAFDETWTYGTDSTGNEIPILALNNGYYEYTTIRLVGDVDRDDDVDLDDQLQVQLAMFTVPGDHNWNPNADLSGDFDVDAGDLRKQQLHMSDPY
jgi:PKD repeat protein